MHITTPLITAGAVTGSQSVTATLAGDPNGTQILLYRGSMLFGQGTLVGGSCVIPCLALSRGDIIQVSVGDRGNRAGIPTLVIDAPVPLSGWRVPTSIQKGATVYTATSYEQTTGLKVLASYDPSLVIPPVAPDVPTPAGAASVIPVGFDVTIEQSAGSTLVRVENVTSIQGGPLVRWASAEGFSNVLTRTYTTTQTITITVQGDGDVGTPKKTGSKTKSVIIFAPSVVAPASSDILGMAYRPFTNFVRAVANSEKQLQCRLEGYDMVWQDMISYEPTWQEGGFPGVPPGGGYTLWVRVKDDATATNWRSMPVRAY